MINLAGHELADVYCELELRRAGIEFVRCDYPQKDEVPSAISGIIGPLKLTRAWYYWRVNGPVPLPMARELYADPVGKTDVRVAGHCLCPPPEAPWIDEIHGVKCISSYHIDSQVGLDLFARMAMKYGLDKVGG
jgi:hypothetical protein